MQSITLDDMDEAVRIYERGLTIKQVVEQVAYSFGTIRRVLHENGVAMRAVGIGERAEPEE
jgi:hypothetical protein